MYWFPSTNVTLRNTTYWYVIIWWFDSSSKHSLSLPMSFFNRNAKIKFFDGIFKFYFYLKKNYLNIHTHVTHSTHNSDRRTGDTLYFFARWRAKQKSWAIAIDVLSAITTHVLNALSLLTSSITTTSSNTTY